MRTSALITFLLVGSVSLSAYGADAGTKDSGAAGATSNTDAAVVTDAASPPTDGSASAMDAASAGGGTDSSLPPIFGTGGSDGAGGTHTVDLDAADSHDGQIRQHFEPNGDPRHASDCSCRLASNQGSGAPALLAFGALLGLGRRRSRVAASRKHG
jgi:MYXO-CTERM domain-containing protein